MSNNNFATSLGGGGFIGAFIGGAFFLFFLFVGGMFLFSVAPWLGIAFLLVIAAPFLAIIVFGMIYRMKRNRAYNSFLSQTIDN